MTISRWQLWNACLGNLFEHYDTALFGFLSPFLASLIFPDHDPITALILTYAIIPIGMLARPLGALVFGVDPTFVSPAATWVNEAEFWRSYRDQTDHMGLHVPKLVELMPPSLWPSIGPSNEVLQLLVATSRY